MNATPDERAPAPHLPPPLPRLSSFGTSTVFRMLVLLVLVLLFLIPISMIQSVLRERLCRRNEAVANITSTWGHSQTLCGPVLIIPYHYRVPVARPAAAPGQPPPAPVEKVMTGYATFLPLDLVITGTLAPSVLHRGIYEAVVYSGTVDISGQFARPSFDEWHIAPEDILWDDALLTLAITDLRGARQTVTLAWGDRPEALRLVPGSKLDAFPSGIHARLGRNAFTGTGAPAAFNLKLTLNGSTGIRFAPLGEKTRVTLTSPWADPSFVGAFLPTERQVGPTGFEATWQVSYYGRSLPQQWIQQDKAGGLTPETLQSSLFGVDLITVVDAYRYVERGIKYGVLFLVLVFTAFFLFEVLAGIRVHPFQYTLVGMALSLFFLAWLSLSEILPFGWAYLAGSAASTLLLAGYSAAVLKRTSRALIVAAELVLIYGFLFVILRLQDYSLLFGTVGLFAALATVMYVTRHIDWYARDRGQ